MIEEILGFAMKGKPKFTKRKWGEAFREKCKIHMPEDFVSTPKKVVELSEFGASCSEAARSILNRMWGRPRKGSDKFTNYTAFYLFFITILNSITLRRQDIDIEDKRLKWLDLSTYNTVVL